MKVLYVVCALLCAFQVSAQDLGENVYAKKTELETLEETREKDAVAEAPPEETAPAPDKTAQLRAALLDFAESQIVRPQEGDPSPDAMRIYEGPGSGRFLHGVYSGRRRDYYGSFVVGFARVLINKSKAVCLEGRVLTIPKLIRVVTTWHQDNPHLWDFTTLHEQLEMALAEQYPCKASAKRRKR